MAIQDKSYLKTRFLNGENPLQEDFADLIDSFMHISGFAASDIGYDATGWNGDQQAPTKNAVRNKIVSMDAAIAGKANAAHTHTASDITDFNAGADARITVQKGVNSGLATLDGTGKVPATQLPAVALTIKNTIQLSLAGQASNANGYFSKNSGSGALPATSATLPGISTGNIDPYVVLNASTLKSVRVTLAQAAVSTGQADAGVTLRLDLYKAGFNTRTLVASLDVPLDNTKTSVSNDLTGNNFQTALLGNLNISLAAGDLIGLQFTSRSGSNTTISSAGGIFVALDVQEN